MAQSPGRVLAVLLIATAVSARLMIAAATLDDVSDVPAGAESLDKVEPVASSSPQLPAKKPSHNLPADVVDRYSTLDFSDVFVHPAGSEGLEYTAAIRALAGKPVRMTGFMVRTVSTDPDVFMFAAHPVATDMRESGLADDVPPNVAHAILPPRAGCGTAWQPFAVTVFGILELGGRAELDGRVSYVRIRAEHITVGAAFELIDVMKPHALRYFRR